MGQHVVTFSVIPGGPEETLLRTAGWCSRMASDQSSGCYLLQRLEDYEGLVILASNLKDQIDVAFTRRFHVLLHFPRPREAERLRIWQQSLPPGVVDSDGDVGWLSRLDLTGAGIVGSVRTAALLAGQAEATSIAMRHLVEAIARQFRWKARVLAPSDLGPYRSLLGASS